MAGTIKGKPPVAKYSITHTPANGKWYVDDIAPITGGQQKEFESAAALEEWITGPIDPSENFFVIQLDLRTNYYNAADPTLSGLEKIKDRSATVALSTSQKVEFK